MAIFQTWDPHLSQLLDFRIPSPLGLLQYLSSLGVRSWAPPVLASLGLSSQVHSVGLLSEVPPQALSSLSLSAPGPSPQRTQADSGQWFYALVDLPRGCENLVSLHQG